MSKLTFISAGAGSGKTHRLTDILYTELSAGRIHPSGVIATTFTRKAATELRERVRGYLLEKGDHARANSMGQARIGTVNGVCGELLRRFAFEAGLPTEQTVLEEEQTKLLIKHAIDAVQDSADAAELLELRDRLGIDKWDERFRELVSTVRANAIAPDALAAFATSNADELVSHLPKPTSDDLSRQLAKAIDAAIPGLSEGAAKVKVTATYLEQVELVRRGLRHGDCRWGDWIKLSKAKPAVAFTGVADGISAIACRAAEHPDLHADIRRYLERMFDLCARVLDIYAQIKRERGLLDFTDQERLLLNLLDDPFVAQSLRDELDLLMVDEFQDTSPIQLALFLKLAEFAKQVYWVGDIKQAIYGFRGSDTALMEAILSELTALGGVKKILDSSWRSRKPLVNLVNDVFVPAFADTLPAEEVELKAQREESLDGPPFAFWRLPGKNKGQMAAALGNALRALVESGYLIHDKPNKRIRPVNFGDIVILRRSNENVTETALELRALGIPAMTAQPGLLATPEAVMALACLRRLNDPGDTIASAQIISLADCDEPETWVLDRLAHVAGGGDIHWRETGDSAHPLLARLAELRIQMPLLAPAEALESAIAHCRIATCVLRWSGSPDTARVRLANLDALIAMARQYETVCQGARHAASVSGLLLWLQEQQAGNVDSLALPAIEAVQVMTHHAAKGLEWPVVVLMDLHGEVKDSLWDSVRAGSLHAISAAAPLRDRTIRYWPWPFGPQKKSPLSDAIAQTAVAASFRATAIAEAKRVLYVSMTRARDLVIIALPGKTPTGPWLETLEAPWLSPPDGATHMQLPSGQAIDLLAADLDPEPKEAVARSRLPLQWFVDPPGHAKRLPRIFNPSAAQSPAMVIVESVSIGMRMDIGSTAERTEVGHVVHGVMALAFADLSVPVRQADVSRIVSAYAMSAHMSDVALTAQVNALRAWVAERWPSGVSLPEWPVESIMSNGQVLNGRIDLLLDVSHGWILIDHKTNSGGHARWPELANEYGGQLLAYKDAIEAASGKPVKELWLTLPVAGAAIRVEPA